MNGLGSICEKPIGIISFFFLQLFGFDPDLGYFRCDSDTFVIAKWIKVSFF